MQPTKPLTANHGESRAKVFTGWTQAPTHIHQKNTDLAGNVHWNLWARTGFGRLVNSLGPTTRVRIGQPEPNSWKHEK